MLLYLNYYYILIPKSPRKKRANITNVQIKLIVRPTQPTIFMPIMIKLINGNGIIVADERIDVVFLSANVAVSNCESCLYRFTSRLFTYNPTG